jgi:hypothetical protein
MVDGINIKSFYTFFFIQIKFFPREEPQQNDSPLMKKPDREGGSE